MPSSVGERSSVGSRSGLASTEMAWIDPARLMGVSASGGGVPPARSEARSTWLRKRPSNSTDCSLVKSSPYHQYQSDPSAA